MKMRMWKLRLMKMRKGLIDKAMKVKSKRNRKKIRTVPTMNDKLNFDLCILFQT